MRIPGTRIGLITRGVAVAVLAATLASCSLGRSPDEIEPTDTPWSDELRYDYVEQEFCKQMRWDDIALEQGITWGDVRSAGTRLPRREISYAECDIREIGAEYLREGAHANQVWLRLDVYGDPDVAYTKYRTNANSEAELPNQVTVAVAGWWDEGKSVEGVRSTGAGAIGSVIYYIYHENMYLSFGLLGQFTTTEHTDVRTAGAIAKFHKVARAVVEEARVHLSCRSLVDPPTSDCG